MLQGHITSQLLGKCIFLFYWSVLHLICESIIIIIICLNTKWRVELQGTWVHSKMHAKQKNVAFENRVCVTRSEVIVMGNVKISFLNCGAIVVSCDITWVILPCC
jgi:hypothetical protein